MSGYTPIFGSVFRGTLCGKYPDTAAWLFLLALADKHGEVDMTTQYISAVTGMPVDDLAACIERFMQPDPCSRSAAEEGRRLVLIDPARPWGWRIVNHSHYREKARKMAFDQARIEDGRNAERMRTRRDPTRPDATRADPPSNANTDSDYGEQLRSSSVGDLSPSESERAPRTAKKADENRRKVAELAAGAARRIPA